MAISDAQKEKILKGEGLIKYTELVKTLVNTTANSITTTIIGDASADGNTLGKAEDRIEALEEAVGIGSGSGQSLSDRMEQAESDIDDLEGAVGELDGRLDDLEGEVVGVGAKRLQNAFAITAPVGSYISELSQNANGDIAAVTTPFPAASTSQEGVVTMASGATTAVVYSKQQIDSMISGSSSDIGGLSTRVDAAEDAIDALEANTVDLIVQAGAASVRATNPIAISNNPSFTINIPTEAAHLDDVYSKDEVDDLIEEAAAAAFTAQVVSSVPLPADAEENVIYFVADGSSDPNAYNEYIKVNTGTEENPVYVMEKIGSTQLSLDYLSTSDVTTIWNETPAAN